MVDIAKVMGDAPREQETAGTSGRVRVSGIDLSSAAAAAGKVGELFGTRKATDISADLDKFANAALDPQSIAEDRDLAQLGQRLELMETQGTLSSAAAARNRQILMTEFIKKHPGAGDKLAERFNKFKAAMGDMTQAADAEAQFQIKQDQERRVARDEALVKFGHSPEKMTEAQRDAVFQENVKGSVDRLNSNKRLLEELQTSGAIETETGRIESRKIADSMLDEGYTILSAEIADVQELDFETARSRLTQLRYELDRNVALFAKGMTPDERDARYGAMYRMIDNELKLNEQRDPVVLADRNRKLSDDELKRVKDENELTKELARKKFYERHGVPESIVVREELGVLLQNWTRADQAGTFRGLFENAVSFTGDAVAQVAKVERVGGDVANVPANLITKGRFMSPPEFVKEIEGFKDNLRNFHRAEITEQSAKLYGQTLFGGLNDVGHATTVAGLDSMMPVLAQPQVAELLNKSGMGDQVAQRANELLPRYVMELSGRVEKIMGADAANLEMDINEKGEFSIRGSSKKVGNRTVTAQVPKTVTALASRINVAVKAYAHLNGMTDYREAARALFGAEE